MAQRTRTRLIGLGAALAVVLSVVGVTVVRADPNPNLAPVTAAELLASTVRASAQPVSISGEVTTRVDLGLPQLPASLGGNDGSVSALLGSQRYRVWRSPEGLRVANILELGEQTLIANRTEAWWWQSDGMQAEHLVYADLGGLGSASDGEHGAWFGPGQDPSSAQRRFDPSAMAPLALAALAPYADVTVDGTARVAGRAAYELVLTPTSSETLIGTVAVAVDAETRLPLRLQVTAKGATEPSIELGFTSVSFDAIDPSVFTFTPPTGARISSPEPPKGHDADHAMGAMPSPTVRTFGSGFGARVAVRLDGPLPAEAAAVLPYAGPLASVLPVDAGGHTWLLFGFVSLDTLRGDADRLA